MRLALDWGRARIGVAACDADGILAYPVETIATRDQPLRRVVALVAEYEPIEVLLGLPRALSGTDGPAAEAMRLVADDLAWALHPIPVCLVDERMSTVVAARNLSAAGKDSRHRRGMIDQAAAVAILEHALEIERSTGRPSGSAVVVAEREGGRS
ncbi:MAG TPA: Holliday junction resolvase RuvX [Propionibacteriaceae bacterium]|nr:Holliday junction resolvase RuvX [Propionibacteriaceae bacterium]